MTIRRFSAAIAAAALLLAFAASGASAYTAHRDLDYDIDSPPGPPPARPNYLALSAPPGAASARRPLVVYVHGGGGRTGDKANQIENKAKLFPGAGYLFASLNYRL